MWEEAKNKTEAKHVILDAIRKVKHRFYSAVKSKTINNTEVFDCDFYYST